jgi:Na+/proline symporter/signal transduction histidine kinase/ActR/RegA family two-component response regulator
MNPWIAAIVAIAYGAILFWLAAKIEKNGAPPWMERRWGIVYALSLGVYCTSWSFYGGVGTAVTAGWNYLPIYLGPMLMFLFGDRFLARLAGAVRQDNSTSIADFISGRFGKSRSLAAIVTLTALFGILPYVALQLKAVGMSFAELVSGAPGEAGQGLQHTAVGVTALALIVFTLMFGARRYDAAGKNRGPVAAIAANSIIKAVALMGVTAFALFILAGLEPAQTAAAAEKLRAQFQPQNLEGGFITITLLAMAAIFCLPRQFYITFIENRDVGHVRMARPWILSYLALFTIAAVPVGIAGIAVLPAGAAPDLYMLDLPLFYGQTVLSMLVFFGGVAAATGMVIVAAITLSTMITHDLVAPFLLRRTRLAAGADIGRALLGIRRVAIIAIIALAYVYYEAVQFSKALSAIGLVAFAASIQFAPALIGALYWRDARPSGARWGLGVGSAVWFYTLFLPSYLGPEGLRASGLTEAFGGMLHPEALFGVSGLDPLTHGVLWSLGLNVLVFVLVSRVRLEQTGAHVRRILYAEQEPRLGRAVTLEDLARLAERFVGREAAHTALGALVGAKPGEFPAGRPIDAAAARHTERLIASVIGAPSARVIVASALSGAAVDVGDVVRLLDGARDELHFSRELLAATMDNISQGVSVVDKDLRLIAWNQRYLELFQFPPGYVYVNRPIADIIRYNAERGECGPGEVEAHVAKRLGHMRQGSVHTYERIRPNGMVLKSMGRPMPGGGYVTTFTDITAEKATQSALQNANERLEERVASRTLELSNANQHLAAEVARNRRLADELHRAKRMADEANLSKTRFLAAASHDLRQPLHAARLFASAMGQIGAGERVGALSGKIDRAIASADEILAALLEISKLDAGAVVARPTLFPIRGLIDDLVADMTPIAVDRGLRLRVRSGCDCTLLADRMLLRSVLQNFLANAIRYTQRGSVLIGCRWRRDVVRVEIWDTGPGIPADKLKAIFAEFVRLNPEREGERGLGLGLAIAERAARLIDARIDVRSWPGKGSVFAIELARADGACVTEQTHPAHEAIDISGLRVLCVDDDPGVLEAMSAALAGWRCRARFARTVDEAKAILAKETFDAALLDVHLGDGEAGGLDIARAIRAEGAHVGIALVTANATEEVRAAAVGLRAPIFGKPAPARELRGFLADAAKSSRRRKVTV